VSDRHVVVLAGGLTHERDVSLRSGSRLAESLRRQGLEVSLRDADGSLLGWLADNKPDAAVIALHGGRGENGAVQGVLHMAGVPYLGTPSHNCRLAWDKATAKTLLHREGFPTPRWITLAHDTFRDLGATAMIDAVVADLGLPLMVKPHQGGSALGASVVHAADQLPAALVGAFAYGGVVLVERFVTGFEVAVSVIDTGDGPTALPAVEISFPGDVFDYEARYTAGMTTYYTPARMSADVATRAAELAVAAHRTLGLRDLSRTDAIVDNDGEVHFLEVNVSPGLTETSMLPMSVAAAGYDLGGLYSQLIEGAIGRAAG
jgi:D-alanine-D-alanine ligase